MKKIILWATVSLLLLFNLLCYAHGSSETTGQYIKSSTVTANVKTQLLADPDIKSLHISVKTVEGVVTLRGKVNSKEQKQKAASIARDVEGVKSVKNQLTIGDQNSENNLDNT